MSIALEKGEILQVLIDTNILIEVIKSNEKIISHFQGLLQEHTFCLSPTIIAELLQGAREKERPIISKLISDAVCLDINCEVGKIAGGYAATFLKSHSTITLDDFIIAATAKYYKTKFWTLNKKHFPMMAKTDLV